MKAEEFMDEILADLDNVGQIKVKEGQTIDQVIVERGEMHSTFISDPSQIEEEVAVSAQVKEEISNIEIVKPEEREQLETSTIRTPRETPRKVIKAVPC